MYNKVFRIIFSAALLLTPYLGFSAATPAAAATLAWSAEPIPDNSGNQLGPPEIDILDMAIFNNGESIFAAPGDSISDNVVYKSGDTGASWTTIAVPVPADLIDVAPDDARIIAIADIEASSVWLSTDGGDNWLPMGVPQQGEGMPAVVISDIAVSSAKGEVHYVAVAGREVGGIANIWYCEISESVAAWQETKQLPGFSMADTAAALAFSPAFSQDGVMLGITASANTSVMLQVVRLPDGNCNSAAAGFSNYPVSIISNGGIAGLHSASLALSPDYHGDSPTTRITLAGLTVAGDTSAAESSGIYRLIDSDAQVLKTGLNIHSIHYDGAHLAAGAYDSNTVYRSDRPLTATSLSSSASMKSPGGENRVVIGLTNNNVIAGTSGDESAFAVSDNRGLYFNDISLIDTRLENISDVAVTLDGSNIYLGSDDGTDFSLWHYQNSWERVFSLRDTSGYIVRIAPDQTDYICMARQNSNDIYLNENRGESRWQHYSCAVNVRDIVFQSVDIAYALSDEGEVSKTSNGGYSWGGATSTGLDSGSMIALAADDYLLAGSQDGYVAYSPDGNTSWVLLDSVLESGAGNVQVVGDVDFATNKTIYAASDTDGQNIRKWIIGTSNAWQDIFLSNLGEVYGLAVGEDGTLYALENSKEDQGKLWYCASPIKASAYASSFKSVSTTATTDSDDSTVTFRATPHALKAGADGKLWAVKTNGTQKLYSFINILSDFQLRSPSSGFVSLVNTVTGVADEIIFSWNRYDSATAYELYLAYDADFDPPLATISVSSTDSPVVVFVGPQQSGAANVYLTGGSRYYWRVRVTGPFQSLYSATRTFTVQQAVNEVPALYVPGNGSTDVLRNPSFSWESLPGADEYQFVLDDSPALDSPIVDITVNNTAYYMDDELDYGKTYYWAVRPSGAGDGSWSALSNFTIMEKPVEATQPAIVVTQAPTATVILPTPEAQPTEVVIMPAPVDTPGYTWVIILISAVLAVLVVFLIIRVPLSIGSGGVSQTGQEEAKPVSFAARSLLWMTSASDEEDADILLSGNEEQELGSKIITRIKTMAGKGLLYVNYPKDAAMFLYLWAHYGSREETNRYLSASFKANAGNVIAFLECYLATTVDADPSRRRFSRQQYAEVARVVDTEKIAEAISKLYGYKVEKLPAEEPEEPGRKLAYQFMLAYLREKNSGEVNEP